MYIVTDLEYQSSIEVTSTYTYSVVHLYISCTTQLKDVCMCTLYQSLHHPEVTVDKLPPPPPPFPPFYPLYIPLKTQYLLYTASSLIAWCFVNLFSSVLFLVNPPPPPSPPPGPVAPLPFGGYPPPPSPHPLTKVGG